MWRKNPKQTKQIFFSLPYVRKVISGSGKKSSVSIAASVRKPGKTYRISPNKSALLDISSPS